MAIRRYNVGSIRRIVQESALDEFEPKFGKNVQSDNKKQNEKAYADMEKATADFSGGFTKEKHYNAPKDLNRGMESLEIENPNKAYSDRVKSQMKGFASKQAEDIHKNEKVGNGEYGSDEMVKQMKDKAKDYTDGRIKATEIGLTGRELDHKDVEAQHKTMFDENKKIKKLTFKNIEFLSEEHMLSRIPDYYMTEGNKFIMRDKKANEYIVEWHDKKPNVTRWFTKENIQENHDHIMHLAGYKSSDTNKQSTPNTRLNENNEISNMLNRVRQLQKM